MKTSKSEAQDLIQVLVLLIVVGLLLMDNLRSVLIYFGLDDSLLDFFEMNCHCHFKMLLVDDSARLDICYDSFIGHFSQCDFFQELQSLFDFILAV